MYEKFKDITAFMFDVDGVFTDASVLVTENGEYLRTMCARDGQAVRYALDAGYKVIIITKAFSEGVRKRFEYLGVTDIYYRLMEKTTAFEDAKVKHNLKKEEILYMGDDLPDAPLFERVSIASCPLDAVEEIKSLATYISPKGGGRGCVRDVIEKVMRTRGDWPGLAYLHG